MSKTATVRARIEPDLKEEVEKLFHELGISTTDAINIFFKQVKLRHGLPFEVAIPNELTQKVLKETDDGKNIVRHENIHDMFKNLGI
ncbi:MAG: type II toxin-antitoxin system RelB/DinJ family antitoxin [Candidatus Aegiribacteria sp.]|nr:type II toxin-antitoxin system RelB/DinJ family antitoxin [Candidatus Aegiribacteria sp.]